MKQQPTLNNQIKDSGHMKAHRGDGPADKKEPEISEKKKQDLWDYLKKAGLKVSFPKSQAQNRLEQQQKIAVKDDHPLTEVSLQADIEKTSKLLISEKGKQPSDAAEEQAQSSKEEELQEDQANEHESLAEPTPEEVLHTADIETVDRTQEENLREKLRKKDQQIEKLYQWVERLLIQGHIIPAIEALGGSVPLLLPVIKQRISFLRSDEKIIIQIYDEAGKLLQDPDGALWTVDDLLQMLKQDKAYGRAFSPSAAKGSSTPARSQASPLSIPLHDQQAINANIIDIAQGLVRVTSP